MTDLPVQIDRSKLLKEVSAYKERIAVQAAELAAAQAKLSAAYNAYQNGVNSI